jgi:yecA family protein
VALVRVDAVELDSGLTCTDLWTNERIELREPELTRDVAPQTVLAVRLLTRADGAVEHDGGVYVFSATQGDAAVGELRAQWNAARERDPGLTEAQFLKRDVPVHINHFWTDHVVMRLGAVARATRDHATGADPSLFDIADPRIRELADFLHSDCAPTAMPIDRLHGYLCAVYCSPELIPPAMWLPLVWGDDPPEFSTDGVAQSVIGGVFKLAQEIANALAEATFEPLLPRRPGPGMDNVAQAWCEGFIDGMALDDDAWDPLVEDPSANRLLTPIFAWP